MLSRQLNGREGQDWDVLDGELLRRARLAAARDGKRLNHVLEEALAGHLSRQGKSAGVAAGTAGSLKLPRPEFDRILGAEPGILD